VGAGRNGHGPGQQAPQKDDRECKAVGQNDQDTLSRGDPLFLQETGEASAGLVEFTEGERPITAEICDFVGMKLKIA
jgi:hypothetical protein